VSWREQYPFSSHYLPLEGARLHYLDEGPRDAPVVVMLHGNPTWSFYWRTLIPGVSQTHRVIVPDHIGCGLSDKPQDYPYTLEQHICNLAALLAHLDVRNVTLLMHDWGGGIGMGYATRHPDNIARLIACNTSAFFEPVLYWPIKLARWPVLGDVALRGFNAFALAALVSGTAQRRRFTPTVRAGYLAPYRSWRDRVAILRFVQDIPMEAGHPTRQTIDEIESRLPLLRDKPLRLFWGARDPVFTVDTFLAGWRKRFPEAQATVFEDAGHYVIEDAHERILPLLLEFLGNAKTP